MTNKKISWNVISSWLVFQHDIIPSPSWGIPVEQVKDPSLGIEDRVLHPTLQAEPFELGCDQFIAGHQRLRLLCLETLWTIKLSAFIDSWSLFPTTFFCQLAVRGPRLVLRDANTDGSIAAE